jgi:Big-like domain-containing protein/glucodextranase-like protein
MNALRTHFIKLGTLSTAVALLASVTAAFGAVAPQVTLLSQVKQGVSTPVRVAADKFGKLYLADPRSGGVLKYDDTGHFIAKLPIKSPRGIIVTAGGDLLVSHGDAVSVLDGITGAEKAKLGKGAGQFKLAHGIAADAAGFIYVVDSIDNCVQVFTAAGAPVSIATSAPGKPANSFGSDGSQSGKFSMPTGITYEKVSNQLAVADTLNGRVQFFDTAGAYRKSIGAAGSGPLKFTSPQGVAFEYSRTATPFLYRMYVVDAYQSIIQVIDPAGSGTFLSKIGGYGTAGDKLIVPTDVMFDQANSRLMAVNGLGNLLIYGINVTSNPVPDITPPQLAIGPAPTVISANSFTLIGTVESEATIAITANTAAVAGPVILSPTKDPATKAWSSLITGLAEGGNQITVTATARAADTAVRTVTVAFIPTATKVTIDPVTTLTNVATQTISGTMDAGATITITTNTTATAGPINNPTPTTWSSTISGLVAGNNTLTVTASSPPAASAQATLTFTLLTEPPNLNVSTLATDSFTASGILNISGFVATDANFDKLTVNLQNNPQEIPVVNGFFSTSVVLTGGLNTIVVEASDRAGNKTQNINNTRKITFDPARQAAAITAPPDGATVNVNILQVTGTAPATSTVKLLVNDIQQATLTTSPWSTNVALNPGLNTVEAIAGDNTSGLNASTKVTVNFEATKPALAVSAPPADIATNNADQVIGGTTLKGVILTATLNGADTPVTLNGDGTFSIPLQLGLEGKYTLTITATDPLGNASTTFRTLLYDTTAPQLTVADFTVAKPTIISGSVEPGSIVTVMDKGVKIGRVTQNADGSWSVDLTGVNYDPATLDIHSTDPAGNSSRNGDLDGGGGKSDIVDAVKAMRLAMGFDSTTGGELLRGDVAPLVNGIPLPDGKIDTGDVLIILRKVVGLINF